MTFQSPLPVLLLPATRFSFLLSAASEQIFPKTSVCQSVQHEETSPSLTFASERRV